MNNPTVIRIVIAIGVAFTLISLAGCQGGMRGARPETRTPSEAVGAPFVEAFLEYVGPPERWAGPRTIVLHLQARDLEPASVWVTPHPAPVPRGPIPFSKPVARAELLGLGTTMQEPQSAFTGCLYPIRARLVRADGSVLERQGCRANTGWAIAVSHILSSVVETATVRVASPARAQVQ